MSSKDRIKLIKIEIKTDGTCGWVAAILTALWEIPYHLFAQDFKEEKRYCIKSSKIKDAGCEYLKLKVTGDIKNK